MSRAVIVNGRIGPHRVADIVYALSDAPGIDERGRAKPWPTVRSVAKRFRISIDDVQAAIAYAVACTIRCSD